MPISKLDPITGNAYNVLRLRHSLNMLYYLDVVSKPAFIAGLCSLVGMNKQESFTNYLRSRGLTFTAERRAILKQILTGPRHFQADELYIRLAQNKNRPISRATVYRTLPLLTASGLIRKVAFVDRHSHYEHLFGHEHLICQKCGRIIEFQDQSLSRLLTRVCKAKKFQLLSHKIEVVGLCSKCS